MTYFEELCKAMQLLSNAGAMFIGQGVGVAGTSMTDTLKGIPEDHLLEFPVAEDMQLGVAIGMSLAGMLPVCIYPRWNFLILATNQLINHLDAIPLYSSMTPKVIIRTTVPSVSPFYPGPQHDGDFTLAFRQMLRTVRVRTLPKAEYILSSYQEALDFDGSTLLVEYTELYRDKVPSGIHVKPEEYKVSASSNAIMDEAVKIYQPALERLAKR